jgi:tRNA-2-methylthio-N6-dimethylallyladenosine synthase
MTPYAIFMPSLARSFFLGMRSGSNRILTAMKRLYSREKIREIVEKLRIASPGIGITTDIIVGHPAETEKEFEETVSLRDIIQFHMAFIVKYSPSIGTKFTGSPEHDSA